MKQEKIKEKIKIGFKIGLRIAIPAILIMIALSFWFPDLIVICMILWYLIGFLMILVMIVLENFGNMEKDTTNN